jgi:hypothetical protein
MIIEKLEFADNDITISKIEEMEKKIQCKIPESYKEFILKNNGGHPTPDMFVCNENQGKNLANDRTMDVAYIGYFIPIESAVSFYSSGYFDGLIPITDAEGGQYICISLNKENYGEIVYFIPEDSTNEENSHLYHLADNFDEFLAGIKEFED